MLISSEPSDATSDRFLFLFFNDTATTEIYTLSLHDALPIYPDRCRPARGGRALRRSHRRSARPDRKSTRLNSSHGYISYAVFCLKTTHTETPTLSYFHHQRRPPYTAPHPPRS